MHYRERCEAFSPCSRPPLENALHRQYQGGDRRRSFDCVVARFAHNNLAQDDSSYVTSHRHPAAVVSDLRGPSLTSLLTAQDNGKFFSYC